jgi:hypothetical protein
MRNESTVTASMSVFGKMVGLANVLVSVWTFYTVFSGFRFGLFAFQSLPPTPWWLLPAVAFQIIFAAILLWVAYNCMVGSRLAPPIGAIVSLGMLLTFTGMFGLVPSDYLAVAIVLCIIAAAGNALGWFKSRRTRRTPAPPRPRPS